MWNKGSICFNYAKNEWVAVELTENNCLDFIPQNEAARELFRYCRQRGDTLYAAVNHVRQSTLTERNEP